MECHPSQQELQVKVNRDPLPKLYPNISSTLKYFCIYVGVVLNSVFSKRPFLAKNKFLLPNFRHFHKNLSRSPMLDCIWKFLVGNRSLTRDTCASERPSKLILWRLRSHMWYFAFHGPCSPSPARSDTSTPKLRAAHLLPAPLETRHDKSTV